MYDIFDYGEYLQRNKIETCNSMFKKRFGSSAKSQHHKCQKIEVFLRVVAFNIDRLIRTETEIVLILLRIQEGFILANITKRFKYFSVYLFVMTAKSELMDCSKEDFVSFGSKFYYYYP